MGSSGRALHGALEGLVLLGVGHMGRSVVRRPRASYGWRSAVRTSFVRTATDSAALPPRVKYFLDPYRDIESTKGCKLNKNHSKLQTYSLGSMHERVTGETLSNAHCSLVDTKAHVSIVLCNEFLRVWKTKSSAKYISEIFTRKGKKENGCFV